MDREQQEICRRFGATFTPLDETCKVGISLSALRGNLPLHGLRHEPEDGTTGWFLWAGDWSDDENFFRPLHAHHLSEDRPEVLPYLALPPGWRFLIAPGHEDVWRDDNLTTEPK